jgi:hypothetical protein
MGIILQVAAGILLAYLALDLVARFQAWRIARDFRRWLAAMDSQAAPKLAASWRWLWVPAFFLLYWLVVGLYTAHR